MRHSPASRTLKTFVLPLLLGSAAMAAVSPQDNELFAWTGSRLQMLPTRPVVGITAGGGGSFAFQDDGQVVEWGEGTIAPPAGIRGAVKVVSDPYVKVVALMRDGTLRSRLKELDSVHKVMDIVARGGRIVVLDSGHVARTFITGGGWQDTVSGVQAATITGDGTWYLRDDGVVLKRNFPSPEAARHPLIPILEDRKLDSLPDLGKFKKLVSGYWHVSGLRADGTVATWGDTSHLQSKVPANLSNVADIQAGWCHTTALRVDGSVESWGIPCPRAFSCPLLFEEQSNPFGIETNTRASRPCSGPYPELSSLPPAQLGKVRAIAAGDNHSLALLENGQIVSWGDSSDGGIFVPEGRSGIAAVAAKEDLLAVLHKNGTLSIGTFDPNTVRWNPRSPAEARRLTDISVSAGHILALDSSGGLHAWKPDGDPYPLPTVAIPLDGEPIPFQPEGIAAISANDYDAIQTKDGRLFVNNGEGSWMEAAPETHGASQILSASQTIYALLANGTVLEMEPASPTSWRPQVATGIRRMYGSDGGYLALLDSSGHLADDHFISAWTAFPPETGNKAPLPPLSTLDLDIWGMVALDSTGRLVFRGDYRGLNAPADFPRLSSVATGRYFAVGIIAPGPLYAKSAPKPTRQVLSQGLALGTYTARLFDPRGSRLWEGQATWTESGWRVPSKHRGLAVLRARTPSGTRTERLILAR